MKQWTNGWWNRHPAESSESFSSSSGLSGAQVWLLRPTNVRSKLLQCYCRYLTQTRKSYGALIWSDFFSLYKVLGIGNFSCVSGFRTSLISVWWFGLFYCSSCLKIMIASKVLIKDCKSIMFVILKPRHTHTVSNWIREIIPQGQWFPTFEFSCTLDK